jgi:hypothetical protein
MFIFVYQRKVHIRGLIVTIQQIKQEIAELKEAIEVKKALPWDCKSFMSRYQLKYPGEKYCANCTILQG